MFARVFCKCGSPEARFKHLYINFVYIIHFYHWFLTPGIVTRYPKYLKNQEFSDISSYMNID